MKTDLFPETLLVSRDSGGRIYTTSLKVAEHFHKHHRHVLRDIDKLIRECASPDFGGPDLGRQTLNFEARTYTYQSGRNHTREARMFVMDRKAFCLLAGRFSGHYALCWQLSYHDAFETMERELAILKERESLALYNLRPRWKAIVDHPDLPRAGLIALTGHKSPASITACRRRMREVGLLDGSTA